jgi:hypothetical protein
LFDDSGCNQRQHDFMVTGKVKTLSALSRGPMNDVGYGAVMLDEIHVNRGEFGKLVIQIAD